MSGKISDFVRRDLFKGAGAAIVAGHEMWRHPLLAAPGPEAAVSFDSHSIRVHGARRLLVSGEIHYSRSPRALWPHLLDRSKALGVNGIASYVFWNVHEPERDRYDFSGECDLGYFLSLCKERDLSVFLRCGPYCCAEWNFGGFPPYLRDEPGITMRTFNQPYLDRVEKYYERLAEVARPYLATRGGPVILVQVENEYSNVAHRYGEQGQEYLQWMAKLAQRVGLADVPTTMCEGAAVGPISTLNGSEVSPKRVAEFRSKNTHDPLLWTELWPAWYDVWGGAKLDRPVDYTRDWTTHCDHDPRSIALSILVFLANGGAGWNYYMWHGGTNFGRTAMYLQTTSYDFFAPLDEFGRATFKGLYLSKLHNVLRTYESYLLGGKRTSAITSDRRHRTTWTLRGRRFVVIFDFPQTDPDVLNPRPIRAQIISPEGQIVLDTQELHRDLKASWNPPEWVPMEAEPMNWQAWSEPLPPARKNEAILAPQPLEQLSLTHDNTDYCWYSSVIDVATTGSQELVIPYGADLFYVYIDGDLVAQTATPLRERRGPITPDDPAHPRTVFEFNSGHPAWTDGYRHVFALPALAACQHRLDILSTAVGLIKGDWMIDSPMNFERKGIWEGVLFNGVALHNWEMIPFLTGEKLRIMETSASTQWSPVEVTKPPCWYKAEFTIPTEMLAEDADYRLNAIGLGKGMLFINGHSVGRHWLIISPGTNGRPTQQYYHLPKSWLRAENVLTVFEEQKASLAEVGIERRRASGKHLVRAGGISAGNSQV